MTSYEIIVYKKSGQEVPETSIGAKNDKTALAQAQKYVKTHIFEPDDLVKLVYAKDDGTRWALATLKDRD